MNPVSYTHLDVYKRQTGFGRCENATDEYKISVEMKAVNHRYLDLSIKMPKKFNYFEAAIRTLLKKYIQRGKVDLFINYEDYTEGNLCLKYNRILAGEYMESVSYTHLLPVKNLKISTLI